MRKQEKIIELGAEGGSISIYKFSDEKGDDKYYHYIQEMSYEDLGLEGVNRKSKLTSLSFPEAMFNMLIEYKNAMKFYPVFVNIKFQTLIIEFLKSHREDIEMNKESWFELLKINEEMFGK